MLGLFVLPLVLLSYSYSKSDYSQRWLFGIGAFCLLFLLGIAITSYHLSSVDFHWPDGKREYLITITDKPQEKAKTYLCPAKVDLLLTQNDKERISKNALIYVMKDSLSRKLSQGDRLLIYTNITLPENKKDAQKFDYAKYLKRKGISGTGIVYSQNWYIIDNESVINIKQQALNLRSKLLSYYVKWGFEGDNLAILSALTLGYKEDLSEEIKEAYSVAGVSHVLALSGLHIGLLFILLGGLLKMLGQSRSSRFLRILIIIVCLWAFAFVSGLSASVVRSAIMFTLIAVSGIMGAKPITLNTLAFAALMMLLYNPFYLYDVGFQLSFIAVASIVIIQPWLYKQVSPKGYILKYLWGTTTVTIAAQLGTAPLIIYYFSSFPVYFLFTNIVVVMLVSWILYLAVVVWVLFICPFVQEYFIYVLKLFITASNEIVNFAGKLPYSSIQNINWNLIDVCIFYLLLITFILHSFIKKRTLIWASLFFILIISFSYSSKVLLVDNKPSILFYTDSFGPKIDFISGDKELNFGVSNHNLKNNQEIPSYMDIIHFYGKTVCMLKDDYWENKENEFSLKIDYLYICKGYKGNLKEIGHLFRVNEVVLDSSLNKYRKDELESECKEYGIICHRLQDKPLCIHISTK